MRLIIFFMSFFSLLPSFADTSTCREKSDAHALSLRTTNYVMELDLDESKHQVQGKSTITWVNRSPDAVSTLRLYMYLNAFSNRKSSYLRNGRGIGSDQVDDRPAEDWGWVKVSQAHQEKVEEPLKQSYVSPTDGNPEDQTVLEIALWEPVDAGDTLRLELEFESKLPRIFGRSGFAEFSFMHWVHWYPKLGVYEEDLDGTWGWNCHQFLPQMEFYGNHGNYEVLINAPSHWTLGGSGCMGVSVLDDSRSRFHFVAHDVIDFAWVASPHLQVIEEQWNDVHLRYLYPSSHAGHADRLVQAATFGLEYMTQYVGDYPYTTLTVLDPPVYGLRSGFMEYPTYITGGSFYAWPRQIRTIESLVLHEFAHQYFMQLLANNEKEEAWLDEGFATYYEDRIMEAMLGERSSLFDVFGYHVSNSAFTRNEYVSIAEGKTDPIGTKSWEIEGPYKAIIYSKTATFLKTLECYMGRQDFDAMMRRYFEAHKFTNPRGEDFLNLLRATLKTQDDNILSPHADAFIDEAIFGTSTCDYLIKDVKQDGQGGIFDHTIRLERRGDLSIPVEVAVKFEDGVDQLLVWDGQEQAHEMHLSGPHRILSVEIDPHRKNQMDINFNNNSFAARPGKLGRAKYAGKLAFWFQQITNTLAVLL
ncbi:MAG: M1 family metallopeptidase [Saprospiraceae bacterium]|nr:M1 family metallopeptidase [Saprospiraceae bacterium]